METTELHYPVFEANQVLSYAHLNDMFEYPDEQSRLTRADLIGIGIVCGLQVSYDAPVSTKAVIKLSRGCGVTSQGYLIVEPRDLAFEYARKYQLPIDVGYLPFMIPGAEPPEQMKLWELCADDDETGAQKLADTGVALDDKAVVLFLELVRDRTRTCAPGDCDDLGGSITTTVRRLLVDVADLDRINQSGDPANAPGMFGGDVGGRLALPDIAMPRFDVPNTRPVTAESVLAAFQTVFRRNGLVTAVGGALSAAYAVFRPLVVDEFPTDPFDGFTGRFGFLETTPETTEQVVFLQYYWDLFDDLIAAYDELRWTGAELVSACCPPEDLFPRHLTAGVVRTDLHATADYRHRFVPSPAIADGGRRSRAVQILFRRLFVMIGDFTENAPDRGVRITPSRTRAALSAKAIPYYYVPGEGPRLYELWNPVRTDRGRAVQNVGYRSDEYPLPVPAFITDPLRFDLEPNDFLRIEGHLGKDFRSVLTQLLGERTRSRLPFEVIALRAGVFDENITIDLREEHCRFNDLDTLYAALVSELRCFLSKQIAFFSGEEGGRGRVLASPLMGLHEAIRVDIASVDIATLRDHYQPIVDRAKELQRGARDDAILQRRLDDIVFRCRIEPFEALHQEYLRRVREVKQAQFLSYFLERNPGIQHKAGVPLGGTFILVYQERTAVRRTDITPRLPRLDVFAGLLDRVIATPDLIAHAEVLRLSREWAQLAPTLVTARPTGTGKVYSDAVAGIADGTIIADFFVPYSCHSGCSPIQYQLPPQPLRLTMDKSCTKGGLAEVNLGIEGGSEPISVSIDGGEFEETTGRLELPVGEHEIVVRDATGSLSVPSRITIPPELVIAATEVEEDAATGTYVVLAAISGGTPPYSVVNPALGAIEMADDNGTFRSRALPRDQVLTLTISDADGCRVEATIQPEKKPCDYPCGGEAVRQGHLFWLPEPRTGRPITELSVSVLSFIIGDGDTRHDLTDRAVVCTEGWRPPVNAAKFGRTANGWLGELSALVADYFGSRWFELTYEPAEYDEAMGTLVIDRPACFDYIFEFEVTYGTRNIEEPRSTIISYREYETRVSPRGTNDFHVPPFNVATANRCDPEIEWTPRCDGTDISLGGSYWRADGETEYGLVARWEGGEQPALLLWQIPDAVPPISAGEEEVRVQFSRPVGEGPDEHSVVLTAYTERGCVVVRDATIDLAKGGGEL